MPVFTSSALLKGNPMRRNLTVVGFLLLCVPCALSQPKSTDVRLMSDTDYKSLLLQIETELPRLEVMLKNINDNTVSQISYSAGKSILDQRNVGLMQISDIRDFINMQRRKRTTYGELALKGFLDSLFNAELQIMWSESANGLTLSDFDKYAPQMDAFSARIGIDALARVQLLEKGTCQ